MTNLITAYWTVLARVQRKNTTVTQEDNAGFHKCIAMAKLLPYPPYAVDSINSEINQRSSLKM